MQDALEPLMNALRRSQTLRLLSVGFIALVLQAPIAKIAGLVSERRERRESAVEEIASKWGRAQAVKGPALVVPYTHTWMEATSTGASVARTEARQLIVLPKRLQVRGKVEPETRRRGIFTVPVYRLGLQVEGEFDSPRVADFGVDPASVAWDRARLVAGISDVRAIQEEATLTWKGQPVAFLPGTGGCEDLGTGIHAVVPDAASGALAFSFPLALHGSLGVSFAPVGQSTVVDLVSSGGQPSFQGAWLPSERTVTDAGFEAHWSLPYLGRNYPQAWTSATSMQEPIEASRFGVDLVDPVDPYRMSQRSVKYAGLFILLTFVFVWLIEVLAGLRIHPIQYLMLGSAMCLFYLLELSLSEHLQFPLAYAVACVAVVGMVAAYSWITLRRAARAASVAAGVAALYVYLYIVLTSEDSALLIGSIGLFAILAAIMYATRRMDWFGDGSGAREAPAVR